MLTKPFLNDSSIDVSNRIKNKFYEEKYLIDSPFFNVPDKRLLVVSDIHYQENVSKDIFRMILIYVMKYKPDYVIFSGDIFENDSIIDNKDEMTFFLKLVHSLSEISKVIFIPGNHDIHNLDVKTWFLKNSKESTKILNFLDSLNRIKNVYFLNNEQVKLDGINFLGFGPSYETYALGVSKEAEELFMNEYTNSGLKMNEDEYNILLTHNPLLFTSSDYYKNVRDFKERTDLIISGHMHGGYIPRFMYNTLKNTDIGIFFYPVKFPYPGISCRGIRDIGRGKLFISKGYRKWTTNIPLFNFFENFSANDVEELTLCNEGIKRTLVPSIKNTK